MRGKRKGGNTRSVEGNNEGNSGNTGNTNQGNSIVSRNSMLSRKLSKKSSASDVDKYFD